MDKIGNPATLFVADSHFTLRPDAAEQRRLQRFLAFLQMAQQVSDLVLLGDIFDFWFDYPNFRLKGYEDLLQGLDRVHAAGTRLHFVGGNHDIWATAYLQDRYGITGDGQAMTLSLGGRRVHILHGDGLLGKDWLYRSFRALVRHPLGIGLAKSLHPEILFKISTWLSGSSRHATRDEAATIVTRAERWLQHQRAAEWDLLVIGHLHLPLLLEHGGRQLAVLAGWLDSEGYGILQDDRFELRDFAKDPPPLFCATPDA